MMKANQSLKYVLLLVGMFSLFGFGVHLGLSAGTIWFVSPAGNNANTCQNINFPCATIPGALAKAASGDTIKVAVGTYTGTGVEVVRLEKDIILLGGWNYSFTSQIGLSVIDSQQTRRGVWVSSSINVTLDHFSVQNGYDGNIASGVHNEGNLVIMNSVVRNNVVEGYCHGGAGIGNYGVLKIERSSIKDNRCNGFGYGGGISSNGGGLVLVMDSTISGNKADGGGGIYSRTDFTLVNSTISQNTGGYSIGGGGIMVDNKVFTMVNSTVAANESNIGGGILVWSGSFIMRNSIIADNIANISPDCDGTLDSTGFNMVSDLTGCTVNSTTGDQLGIDPQLGELQDNGGPTFTQWLYAGSPAIDGGDPAGCKDAEGNPLLTDQRSSARPLDGDSDGSAICDIGAYEVDPNNSPPPMDLSVWYVNPTGSDSNDCLSPARACAAIGTAVDRADPGDSVYLTSGIYTTSTGSELVLIDKDLTIAGGWDTEFTNQTSLSILDGQDLRQVIIIGEKLKVVLTHLIVQHGVNSEGDGGGIYIGSRTKVVLNSSIVRWNVAGVFSPLHPGYEHGGGIGLQGYGFLTVNDSQIIENLAYGSGGGIYSDLGYLTLNNSYIANNLAGTGGGISGSNNSGTIIIDKSYVINNISNDPLGDAGGINAFHCVLVIKNSTISNNRTSGEGGGILGHDMTIENSLISGNQAGIGGGIDHYFSSVAKISNSAIIHNISTLEGGGGISSKGDLVIRNSTIAYNQAEDPHTFAAKGGGIYYSGDTIQGSNVTIVGNYAVHSGGGIWNADQVVLRNSILTSNQAPLGPNCTGNLGTAGFNLVGNMSGCNFTPLTGDLVGIDPGLSRLFGWPYVLALQPDSPAIDSGDPGGCRDEGGSSLLNDQIGTDRSLDGDGDSQSVCDIGAFEYDPAHPPRWIFMPLFKR
jgi:hypothetical protein